MSYIFVKIGVSEFLSVLLHIHCLIPMKFGVRALHIMLTRIYKFCANELHRQGSSSPRRTFRLLDLYR
jgi:hypothetical protein